ncbi:P-loop containing nucleoside triphosphate hydrolase [Pseudocohnilembus persalinus]|uniref:Ras-related protein Rab-1 n=1 Tax=Pseudocohnilembus persalinus TaxID=266149 RepID=A0A0V0QIU3_PSEPJ|nr:P-loop containing nucleoside triphosphate hydrolase [Pseudocohnilembus persalinus]|eukprot:KRX02148.1 P-loop containing nucleoside triphosphate hydrolase [Pseudocohnilembus persalinus]
MNKRDQGGFDWLVKLLIIGDSGVGKTNILTRFCDDQFTTSHLTTIGIDFKIKTIDIDGKKIKLQVWDTAGQERFKTITQTYYKGSMGIIMVYAINDRETFQNIESWMKQIKTHASQDVCKILVGNKCDMVDRQVQTEEGKQLAQCYDIQFFEVSAKDNINIAETFLSIAKDIKEKLLLTDGPNPNGPGGTPLRPDNGNGKTSQKSGCC